MSARPSWVGSSARCLSDSRPSVLFHIAQLPLKSLVNISETENPTGNKSDHELPEGALKSDLLL